MAKVNISLPDGLLSEIDAKAAERGTTRSGFIQEAAAGYVTALDAEKAEAERDARFERALRHAKEIGRMIDPDFDEVAAIRHDRDSDHGRLDPDE